MYSMITRFESRDLSHEILTKQSMHVKIARRQRVDRHSRNNRDRKQYRDDRRRLVIDSYHNQEHEYSHDYTRQNHKFNKENVHEHENHRHRYSKNFEFDYKHDDRFKDRSEKRDRRYDDERIFKNFRSKYKKVFYFFENRAKFKKWRIHLKIYIKICVWQFRTTRNIIDFIKDHLEEDVYDNVKNRVDSNSSNSYHNLEKILRDLKLLYKKKNKIARVEIKFKNVIFRMKVFNKIETFEQFVTRYNVAIALLNFNDDQKIRWLKYVMISRLQHKIEHLTNIKNDYYVYVKSVRDINDYVNDILSNNINRSREISNKFKSKISRVIARYVVKNYRKKSMSLERTIKIENHFITRFSTHIRQQILEEHRCFKCLKKNIALSKMLHLANINR